MQVLFAFSLFVHSNFWLVWISVDAKENKRMIHWIVDRYAMRWSIGGTSTHKYYCYYNHQKLYSVGNNYKLNWQFTRHLNKGFEIVTAWDKVHYAKRWTVSNWMYTLVFFPVQHHYAWLVNYNIRSISLTLIIYVSIRYKLHSHTK